MAQWLADTTVTSVGRAHVAALAFAGECPDVVAALGLPLRGEITAFEQVGFGDGSRVVARGSIEGPDGRGAIRYEARSQSGVWRITRGTVEVDAAAASRKLSA